MEVATDNLETVFWSVELRFRSCPECTARTSVSSCAKHNRFVIDSDILTDRIPIVTNDKRQTQSLNQIS